MAFKLTVFAALVAVSIARPQHHGHESAYSSQTIHLSAPSHESSGGSYEYHGGSAQSYHAAPVAIAYKAAPILKAVHVEPEAPAHYQFEYSVHDPHTGDVKEQKESNHDGKVEGFYSLHEADGTKRIVHYTADKHSGFNAVVTREGKAVHAQPVKVAAPVLLKAAIPISHGGYSSGGGHSSEGGYSSQNSNSYASHGGYSSHY